MLPFELYCAMRGDPKVKSKSKRCLSFSSWTVFIDWLYESKREAKTVAAWIQMIRPQFLPLPPLWHHLTPPLSASIAKWASNSPRPSLFLFAPFQQHQTYLPTCPTASLSYQIYWAFLKCYLLAISYQKLSHWIIHRLSLSMISYHQRREIWAHDQCVKQLMDKKLRKTNDPDRLLQSH